MSCAYVIGATVALGIGAASFWSVAEKIERKARRVAERPKMTNG